VTDLAGVLAGLQAVLAADAAIGLDGSEANHLRLVAPNVEWIVAQMPSAALLVAETQRVAGLGGQPETVTATFEVRLAIDGGNGRGDVSGIVALVEQVRRVLIQHDTLNGGNPPTALIGASRPTGETYEVIGGGDRGWLQTAILRWQATWVQPRVFDDAPLVDARYVRVISVTPGQGVTEQQPPS
jgi:hypothetical protein